MIFFEVVITIDLEHVKAMIKAGKTTVERRQTASLEQMRYVGIYAKSTQSVFSKIERVG
ncbi:MAG: hypothetical protein ABF379_03445 [Akkermansiaceae bacterium]